MGLQCQILESCWAPAVFMDPLPDHGKGRKLGNLSHCLGFLFLSAACKVRIVKLLGDGILCWSPRKWPALRLSAASPTCMPFPCLSLPPVLPLFSFQAIPVLQALQNMTAGNRVHYPESANALFIGRIYSEWRIWVPCFRQQIYTFLTVW